MKKHIANTLTGVRILGSMLLLFFPVFSASFYTDMIDGTVARKTNSVSEFGSKLDTAADLAFVTASLIKLLPAISIPQWVWIWGGGIAMIKIGTILWAYISRKQFIALHTILNKITGLLLFLLPLTLSFVDLNYSTIAACSIATVAAIQEAVSVAAN